MIALIVQTVERKQKVLISCIVMTKLICIFIFAHAEVRVSTDVAHLSQCIGESLLC